MRGGAKGASTHSGWNGRKARDNLVRSENELPIHKRGPVKVLQPKRTQATRRMKGGLLATGYSGSRLGITQADKELRDDQSTITYDSEMLRKYTRAAKNATGAELRKDLYDEDDYGYLWAHTERNKAMLGRELAKLRK